MCHGKKHSKSHNMRNIRYYTVALCVVFVLIIFSCSEKQTGTPEQIKITTPLLDSLILEYHKATKTENYITPGKEFVIDIKINIAGDTTHVSICYEIWFPVYIDYPGPNVVSFFDLKNLGVVVSMAEASPFLKVPDESLDRYLRWKFPSQSTHGMPLEGGTIDIPPPTWHVLCWKCKFVGNSIISQETYWD